MAAILEFPIVKLAPSRNRWTADEDLHADIVELSVYRQTPVERALEWQAISLVNANLRLD